MTDTQAAPPAGQPGGAPAATRRERTGWYFYDWAMSAFSTTSSFVFPGTRSR